MMTLHESFCELPELVHNGRGTSENHIKGPRKHTLAMASPSYGRVAGARTARQSPKVHEQKLYENGD